MALNFGTIGPNTSGMDTDSRFSSFRSVIALWESREAMAADVGTSNWSVIKWFKRDTIPSEWWTRVLETEKAKSEGLTSDLFARLAARLPEEARA